MHTEAGVTRFHTEVIEKNLSHCDLGIERLRRGPPKYKWVLVEVNSIR